MDNITSSLLFGDGAAAMLLSSGSKGVVLEGFYSEVISKGKRDMAWEISSTGFLMTLSGYVPELIEEDFEAVVSRAMQATGTERNQISDWCIHPGGKRILQAIEKSMQLQQEDLSSSYGVLNHYGNMSSATILFVLHALLKKRSGNGKIFGAAFGPGLTVETFTAAHSEF
jgi:predicted naringenin-chalcone synthase